MGEWKVSDIAAVFKPVGIDTYAGKVNVEWDPQAVWSERHCGYLSMTIFSHVLAEKGKGV